jgi:pyruvate dehydrogenase E1 component alpha subunit
VLAASLKNKGIADDAKLKGLEDRARAEVERAVKFADESPEPAPEELFTHVYANPISRQS